MKKLIILLALFIFVFFSSFSQLQFESTLSAGGTIINIERLVAIDENVNTVAENWGLFTSGLSAQIYYASYGNISLGTEFMFQHLYWYSVRIPYGSQPIYREYEINVYKLSQIVRFGAENAFNVDFGPEINFNSDGVMLGLLGSVNYFIQVNDKIDIPLKLRAELMSGIVIMAPVTINAGVRIKL